MLFLRNTDLYRKQVIHVLYSQRIFLVINMNVLFRYLFILTLYYDYVNITGNITASGVKIKYLVIYWSRCYVVLLYRDVSI